MVEEIAGGNHFANNSIRLFPVQDPLERMRPVDRTSKDPQFWNFRNHPSAPFSHHYTNPAAAATPRLW